MSKPWTVSIELTSKELNYIDAGLRDNIFSLESRGKIGNVPQLLWFTKRLRGKLKRINRAAVRAHMTPEQKRNVTRYLRRAFKKMRAANAK